MTSDHLPLLLASNDAEVSFAKPFPFKIYWTCVDSFHTLVSSVWAKTRVESPMFRITSKLKNVKFAPRD